MAGGRELSPRGTQAAEVTVSGVGSELRCYLKRNGPLRLLTAYAGKRLTRRPRVGEGEERTR